MHGVRRAALVFIFITVVIDVLALGIVIPVLPKLVVSFEGGDTARAADTFGIFMTVWGLMQFVSMPVIGALSDHFGRRPVILLSCFGMGCDYFLMAWAPTLGWLLAGPRHLGDHGGRLLDVLRVYRGRRAARETRAVLRHRGCGVRAGLRARSGAGRNPRTSRSAVAVQGGRRDGGGRGRLRLLHSSRIASARTSRQVRVAQGQSRGLAGAAALPSGARGPFGRQLPHAACACRPAARAPCCT